MPTRTNKQNDALHKYLSDLANELQAHGITQKMFIDELKGWDVPITKEFLKQIWKMKQEKMFLTNSTTQMETDQVSQVYDAVNMFTSTVFGIGCAFPSEEQLQEMQELRTVE